MFIDTHTHLDFDSYDEDREIVIQRAIENKVSGIITIGTDLKSSEQAVKIAEKYASVFAAVGIHPSDCASAHYNDFEKIKELTQHEKVVAIGEIGLDYYHMHADKETQKNIFKKQIKLATELNLPLIIHNRDSHDDMYEIISNEGVAETGGVLHSFSGDESFLEKILLTNLYISFTGNITFKKSTTDPLVIQTPLENLLLETDSPFLTPAPLRGKRNEPAFLVHTAKKIADLKGISIEELGSITSDNAKTLFKLNL
jgi:TatD DNase family protein